MKISIFIVILFISLAGKAQQDTDPVIISLDSAEVVSDSLEYKFNFATRGYSDSVNIIKQPQSDIYFDEVKIVEVSRDTANLSLIFKLKNITKENYKAVKEKLLRQGCNLKEGGKDRIHVSFNIVNAPAEQTEMEGTDTTIGEVEKDENSMQQDSIKNLVKGDLYSIQDELKITQYAAIVMGVILLILIIVLSKCKVKGRFVREFDERNSHVDHLFTTINDKIRSLEEVSERIRNDVTALKKVENFPVSNESKSKPSIQRDNPAPAQKSREEVVYQMKTPSKGYVAEPKIDGILDKNIKSECDEYCIYEIQYISTNEAYYFINKDAKALQNIISQAYMLGDYNDETKGQQAIKAETVDYGILQKNEDYWRVVKPLKFTIR